MGAMPDVVVVVPCFNEAERLRLEAFRESLAAEPALSYVLVNDGSADRTRAVLDGFAAERPERVRALHLERNCRESRGGSPWHPRRCDPGLRADWLLGRRPGDPADRDSGDGVAAFANSGVGMVIGSRVPLARP